jgi:CheY-like chemotaxis protein
MYASFVTGGQHVEELEDLHADGLEQRPIIVVDDDEAVAGIIACLLVDEGYPVVVAHNGLEAMERLVTCQPRMILLDMQMPRMDGQTFVARYRQQPAPHAPIIVMSAAYDLRLWAKRLGAQAFLPKPFDLDHMLDLVHQYAD